jgi:hypothetical protein
VPQLVLRDGFGVVDLVAEDQEGHFGELFEVEEFVEGVFGFREALGVFGVDEVDDAVDFGEVLGESVSDVVSAARESAVKVWRMEPGGEDRKGEETHIAPYPACLEMAAQVKGCEAAVADGEFLASCMDASD